MRNLMSLRPKPSTVNLKKALLTAAIIHASVGTCPYQKLNP